MMCTKKWPYQLRLAQPLLLLLAVVLSNAQDLPLSFQRAAKWSTSPPPPFGGSVVLVHESPDPVDGIPQQTSLVMLGDASFRVIDAEDYLTTINGGQGPSDVGPATFCRVGEGSTILGAHSAFLPTGGGGSSSSQTPTRGTVILSGNFLLAASLGLVVVQGVDTLVAREGASLFRLRDSAGVLKYLMFGGTSDALEELTYDEGNAELSKWSLLSSSWLGSEQNVLQGASVAVVYVGGLRQRPVICFGGGKNASNPNNQQSTYATFVEVETSAGRFGEVASFHALLATAFNIESVVARESYVLAITSATLAVDIFQLAYNKSSQHMVVTAITSAGAVPGGPAPSALTSLYFPQSQTLGVIEKSDGNLYVNEPMIPGFILGASVVSRQRFESHDGSFHSYTVEVEASDYFHGGISLAMFSYFDDCSEFLDEGPFPLPSTRTVLRWTLRRVREGSSLFLCTTLGSCPPVYSETCSVVADSVACFPQGKCMYGLNMPLRCCDREKFEDYSADSGVVPVGSMWMLSWPRPLHFSTMTPTLSVSDVTISATRTAIETPSEQTLTETVTLSSTQTITSSTTVTSSLSVSLSPTSSPSPPTSSSSATVTDTLTVGSQTPTISPSASQTITPSQSKTASPSHSRTATVTVSPSDTWRLSKSAYPTPTHTLRMTPTLTSRTMSPQFADAPDLTPKHPSIWIAVGIGAASVLVLVAALCTMYMIRKRRSGGAAARRSAMESSLNGQSPLNQDARTPRGQGSEVDGGEAANLLTSKGGTPIYSMLLNSNKYTLSKLLGKGGYGMVFLAIRNSDQKKAALKYITCRTDYDRSIALREFEVIMKVKHPNIIPIWDFFLNWQEHVDYSALADASSSKRKGGDRKEQPQQPQGVGFLGDLVPFQQGDDATTALTRPRYVAIVTQYFPEGDLKKYCYTEKKQGRQLSEERIVSLMTQVVSLVVKLHDEEHQIVHRDLKPENILLDCGYKKAVVTDFGLAFNNVNEASHMTTQAGSLPFVAPECWTKHYNYKVDVWSLGCVLYSLCTQRVTGDDSRVMFNDVDETWFADEIYREVCTVGQYSKELYDILMKMLHKNPFYRPTTFDVENMLWDVIDARDYQEVEYITRTSLPRPSYALEREAREDRMKREAEERQAAETAARKKAREAKRKQREENMKKPGLLMSPEAATTEGAASHVHAPIPLSPLLPLPSAIASSADGKDTTVDDAAVVQTAVVDVGEGPEK